jgi:hypothetical protein
MLILLPFTASLALLLILARNFDILPIVVVQGRSEYQTHLARVSKDLC